jgi:hypothetical protein
MGKGEPNPASGIDGYGWVKKAIGLRGPDDLEMEFAAASTVRNSSIVSC